MYMLNEQVEKHKSGITMYMGQMWITVMPEKVVHRRHSSKTVRTCSGQHVATNSKAGDEGGGGGGGRSEDEHTLLVNDEQVVEVTN